MWSDENGVPDPEWVLGPAAQHRVLHHQDIGSDLDRSAVSGDDRAVEHPARSADSDVAGHDRGGCDPGGGVDA